MTHLIKFTDNTISHATGHVWCHADHVLVSHEGSTYRFSLQQLPPAEDGRENVVLYAASGRTTKGKGKPIPTALAQYLVKLIGEIYQLDSYRVQLNKTDAAPAELEATPEALEALTPA